MNKLSRLTALLLALMMLISTFAAAETGYPAGGMTVDQWQQMVDQAADEVYVINEGDSGKTITPEIPAQPAPGPYAPYTDGTTTALVVSENPVTALRTPSGVAVLTHAGEGQWQMLVGDVWADLTGETGDFLWVTPAMMSGFTTAQFRKALAPKDERGQYTSFTQVAEVSVTDALPAALYAAPRADASAGEETADGEVYSLQRANENLEKHLITIEYRFLSNSDVAANPYYAEVSTTTTSFSAEIQHPIIMGYKPTASFVGTLPGGFAYTETQMTLSDVHVTENLTVVVYYEPAEVKYTVNYWEELAVYTTDPATGEEVKYALAGTVEDTGLTESTVRESSPDTTTDQYWATLHTPAGFQALLYDDNVKLAADGSTVVDVYYQRKYYLMVFNLGGGYGVNPIYTKHGVEIGDIGEPKRPGYVFKGWTDVKDGTTIVELPDAMPTHNSTYYAVWEPTMTTYSVMYWFEKADSTDPNDPANYSTVYVVNGVPAMTESTVTRTNHQVIRDIEEVMTEAEIAKMNEKPRHFDRYDAITGVADRPAPVEYVVAGDGSTIVNVYYTRKEYTIRFFYMRSETNGTKYEIPSAYGQGAKTNCRLSGAQWNHSEYSDYPGILPEYASMAGYADYRINGQTHRYYYLELTAKYNADLTAIWPNLPFQYSNGSDYHGRRQNSWAIHGDAPYFDTIEDTYTFKGIYSRLDDNLIPESSSDPILDIENGFVTYFVSYWGSSNSQDEYRYNIYFEVLEPNTPGAVEYGNKYYVLQPQLESKALSGSEVKGQNAPAHEGVYNVGKTPTTGNGSIYHITDIHFYYDRNKYNLIYMSNGEQIGNAVEVPFGAAMGQYETTPNIQYAPDTYYVFGGWYTSEKCVDGTEYDFNSTMPAANVTLYAKWTPLKYTVTVYNTKEDADTALSGGTAEHLYYWPKMVEHGKAVSSVYTYTNPDHYNPETGEFNEPTREGWTFTYWFYYDENGNEQPFSFNNTPITRDTVVYAGWTASELATYTIYYVVDDGNPNTVNINQDNWVAVPVNGSGLAGATTTERAKGGTELYTAFQTEYFPTVESHSFTLDVDASKNVYVFEYVKVDEVPYKVLYVTAEKPDDSMNKGTVTIDGKTYYMLADTKEVDDNTKAVVTENYAQIGGSYVPDAFQKRLILKAGTSMEENVIVFYYTKDETSTTLEVNHILVHADGSETSYDSVKQIVKLPHKETVTPKTIANYPYKPERTTVQGEGVTTTDTEIRIDLEEGADGVVINLYYVENTVDIQYIPVGPEGYDENGMPNVTAAGSVDPETETVGVVTGQPGSTATANRNYSFVGWYKDAACTNLVTRDADFAPEKVNGVHVEAIYYAKFVENEATINYVVVGPAGCGTVDPESETLPVLSGEAEGSTAAANVGYTFLGWYEDEAGQQPVDAAWVTDGKIVPQKPGEAWPETSTYYAKFEENKATIRYAVGPAYAGMGTVSPESETLLVWTDTATGSEATPTDKTIFEGWYLDAECTKPVPEAWMTGTKITPAREENAAWVDGAIYYAKFAYKPGQLDITKTVVNNTGKPLTVTAFTFTVTLTDAGGQPLTGTYTCVIGENSTTVTPDAEGKIVLTLDVGAMNGESASETRTVSASILNLPHGTQYAVAETHVEGCLITFENANGQIEATETSTAAFTNTFPAPSTSTLTVIKAGMQPGESAVIRVDVDGKIYYLSLSSTHSQDTITGLPIGSTYTVTELNAWTWQYENTTPVTGEILRDGASKVTITNKPTDDKWMHDESSVINDLGDGSKTNINNQ